MFSQFVLENSTILLTRLKGINSARRQGVLRIEPEANARGAPYWYSRLVDLDLPQVLLLHYCSSRLEPTKIEGTVYIPDPDAGG